MRTKLFSLQEFIPDDFFGAEWIWRNGVNDLPRAVSTSGKGDGHDALHMCLCDMVFSHFNSCSL